MRPRQQSIDLSQKCYYHLSNGISAFSRWLSLRNLTPSFIRQQGHHKSEQGATNCKHTAEQLDIHCNLVSLMRTEKVHSNIKPWLESWTTSTTRWPLYLTRLGNRPSQTRRISRAKRRLWIFLQIVCTSLKTTIKKSQGLWVLLVIVQPLVWLIDSFLDDDKSRKTRRKEEPPFLEKAYLIAQISNQIGSRWLRSLKPANTIQAADWRRLEKLN